jgi:hypothetical protein
MGSCKVDVKELVFSVCIQMNSHLFVSLIEIHFKIYHFPGKADYYHSGVDLVCFYSYPFEKCHREDVQSCLTFLYASCELNFLF